MARKGSGFRCRSLLLVFLCILWIYHNIDQRTRNSESSGTTSDRTEETVLIPARNEASLQNSHPAIFGDVFDSSPPWTITAVLPVTSSSLSLLSESLSGLSEIPSLTEIHLLCPENVTNAARNALRQALSRAQGFGHTEFFVTLWWHGWSEAESTLRVASRILSNGILILPQDALANIDSLSRSILFSGPPSFPVPLGLRGSEVRCATKYHGFLAAQFVLPPLLLPPRLGATNQSYFHLTSWQELGAHFAQVEGVGGVVPSDTSGNTSSCRHLNASETTPLRSEHSYPPPDPPEPEDPLVILVAEREDILVWSKLACEFKSRGKEAKIIVLSDPLKPSDPASEDCDLVYIRVHDLQDPAVYQFLDYPLGISLTLTEYHLPPGSPLEANNGATVIRIPRRDLPHCDWIASLEIRELRSEHPWKFYST